MVIRNSRIETAPRQVAAAKTQSRSLSLSIRSIGEAAIAGSAIGNDFPVRICMDCFHWDNLLLFLMPSSYSNMCPIKRTFTDKFDFLFDYLKRASLCNVCYNKKKYAPEVSYE